MSGESPWRGRRLHFVGVGGCGMSGLALVAQALGARVTGSDRGEGPYLSRLVKRGIPISVGHRPEQVPEQGELVYSTAVQPDNPERVRARERGLREVRRGELLAELSKLRRCIAVSGTHGKTTTAAMTYHVLRSAGMRPSYLIGADLLDTGLNARWDEGEWLVIEADESDRTFLALEPEVAVVTNIELEHPNEYSSLADLQQAFGGFLSQARHAVIWNRSRPPGLREQGLVAFDAVEPRLTPGGVRFAWHGHDVRLPVPGEHNARNAAAALEAARCAGADLQAAVLGLASYPGTRHRLEAVGETRRGARVYDDYAHHPTAVRTTLEALRSLGSERIVAVYEPLLFSRTRLWAHEFAVALALADVIVVLEVYPLRERREDHPGVSGRTVVEAAEAVVDRQTVASMPTLGDAERYLRTTLRRGDACVTLGISEGVQGLARSLVE
jgi:UDP-N-acetylmuramate--alanine ligase